MKLIFATNNQHKVIEMQEAVGQILELISLRQAGIDIDIPEPHASLEKNAAEKSWTIYRKYGINCFAEDTGLEVEVLNGAPGVQSARYAGDERSDDRNIDKLLTALNGQEKRTARFRTVLSLILNGREYCFEGICKGHITTMPLGSEGFGYDSVFVPDGATKTFAEMPLPEKQLYSHRKKASDQLVALLHKLPVLPA